MKAALCKSFDGPQALTIETLPDPVPGPGEAVVRVKAAALNFLDTLITRGKYQYKPEFPFSPSAEFAGVVEALGSDVAADLKVGQRVFGYVGYGAARERLALGAERLVPLPDPVSDAAGASLSVIYGTAVHGLRDRGRLQPGETVAVLGASGGAGLAAVEIASLLGAKVIAVASSPEKLEICRQHGAAETFDYSKGDLKQGLRDLTGGRGVDVIYDCVGGDHAEPALRSIAWGGRYLVVGFAAGQIPRIPLNLLLLKSCDLVGVFWGESTRRDPAGHRRNMIDVARWVAEGRLTPHIHATYPLERIADAIDVLDTRKVAGKVILVM
ncbi:MAG: NADPH:quinone oxidoreductase family protein [Hyphomicrobiaceae bacterium]